MTARSWNDIEDGLFTAHRERVLADWLDYNDHMNLAYYVLAFDHATDRVIAEFGIDDAYRAAVNKSVFVAETHVVYLAEAVEGEELLFATRILGHGAKKLHLFHEMFSRETGALIATNELMVIHVDLGERRAVPFGERMATRIATMYAGQADIPEPPQAGRRVAL